MRLEKRTGIYFLYTIYLMMLFTTVTHSQVPKRYRIIDLGTFGAESYATGINNKGHVVGASRVTGASYYRAFIWQDSVMTDLGTLTTGESAARSINDSDEVTGNSDVNPQPNDEGGFDYDRGAFFWKDGSMSDIGHLGGHASWGYAINNSGVVVGASLRVDSLVIKAYSWNGSIQDLGIDDNFRSEAWGINNSGQIIGWKDIPGGESEGWMFDGGLTTSLGQGVIPYDINDQGEIVGRYRPSVGGGMHAFLWKEGNLIDLSVLANQNYSEAFSINSSGEIVGIPAFIYKDGEVKNLNSLIEPGTGWVLSIATGINDLGMIVGSGFFNGQQRAFLLIPELKITKPESNSLWIAGEKDTIKWSGGRKNQLLQIDYSIDSGRTFNIIDIIANGDTGLYVWDIPINILSKKCMIRIVDMADTTIADTSDVFKIKSYILTRDSSGQYEPYRTEEDQWGFWNNPTGEDMFPQSWYQQFDYQGTDPFTNSNYSLWQGGYVFLWAKSSDFPDWVSWVNTFGVNACYLSTTSGIYSPLAVLRWAAIKNNWIGSCFGIAASNALAFAYKGQFQTKYTGIFPAFANPNTVSSDNGVKKVVNELFTHQFGNPSRQFRYARRNDVTPNQTIRELKEMFKEDNVTPKTLSIWNNSGSGGHNILPYKIEQDIIIKNLYYLHVYDNSYPNKKAVILIDTSGNSNNGIWGAQYAWPNWGGPKYLILENESIDYFNNATLPKRTEGSASPFILSSDELEVYTNIDANTIIIDALGNITGYINDSVLSEIPNSIPMFYLDGTETPPYGYSLPTDNYSVLVDSFTTDTVKTFFFTGNRTFTYKRYDAVQNQTDRLLFDGGVSAANPDAQTKTISLLNIINETTQEKLFSFNSMELAQNDSVKIENPDSNKIKLKSFGTAKDYDIELNYVTENGIGRFGDFDVPLEANTSHTFVPDWSDVTNTDLMVLVDNGNNGTIDDTLYLQNQVTGIGDDQGSLVSPDNYNLAQNYPNPFNPVTTIQYSIPQRSNVTLKVYDVLGNEVAILVDEYKPAGRYEVNFDASGLSSGVYFYKIKAGNFVETKKMILMK